MVNLKRLSRGLTVALFVSAWIEISNLRFLYIYLVVALFVSAWIEIFKGSRNIYRASGRTLCECVD